MIENLHTKQKDIIERAAGLVKPARREDFKRHVFDQLRAKLPPYANTTIRSTCAVSLLKFRPRRSR
jgi:hypothetical protein